MSEVSKEQMLELMRPSNIWRMGPGDEEVLEAIRRLIESSVKITTVGGGLFSHYPQGRAKQTEGSESSGERAAPPAKEGVSVSGADIEVMAGALVAWGRTLGRAECGQETLPDDAPIPQNIAPIDYVIRRLRSLGIRVEGEPEGGGG